LDRDTRKRADPDGDELETSGMMPPMKWEYQTIKLAATGFMGGKVNESQLDQKMNELGAQGWELAAAFDTDIAGGGTRDVVVIFKRARD
jgi:hypothetical protein